MEAEQIVWTGYFTISLHHTLNCDSLQPNQVSLKQMRETLEFLQKPLEPEQL